MLLAIPAVIALNFVMGTERETVYLFALTWLYNDLAGGNEVIVREAIISLAFGFYNLGSLKVAMGPYADITEQGYMWIGIVSAVIFTTMNVQDLKDQPGDRLRGRRTIPLVFGEAVARYAFASFVLGWSICCAIFWGLKVWTMVLPVMLGAYIAYGVVCKWGFKADARTWRLWCLWTAVLYTLPLLREAQNFLLA